MPVEVQVQVQVPVEVVPVPEPQDVVEVIELPAAAESSIVEGPPLSHINSIGDALRVASDVLIDPNIIDMTAPAAMPSIKVDSSSPLSSVSYLASTSTSFDHVIDPPAHDSISAIDIKLHCKKEGEKYSNDMTIEGRCQENRISNENHWKLDDKSCVAECLQKIKTAEEEEEDEIEELRREFEIAIAEDKENMNALKKKSVMEGIKLSSKSVEEEGNEVKEEIVQDKLQKQRGEERREIVTNEKTFDSYHDSKSNLVATVVIKNGIETDQEEYFKTMTKQSVDTDIPVSSIEVKNICLINEMNPNTESNKIYECPESVSWNASLLENNLIGNEMNSMDADRNEKSISLLISQYIENLQQHKRNLISHRQQFIHIVQVRSFICFSYWTINRSFYFIRYYVFD